MRLKVRLFRNYVRRKCSTGSYNNGMYRSVFKNIKDVKRMNTAQYSMKIPTLNNDTEKWNQSREDQNVNKNLSILKTVDKEYTNVNVEHNMDSTYNTCDIPDNFEQGVAVWMRMYEADTISKNATESNKPIKLTLNKDKNASNDNKTDTRINEINMQMLSKSLHEQVFKNSYEEVKLSPEELRDIKENLNTYGINVETATRLPNVNINLPPLQGANIEEHFYNIAEEQTASYLQIINKLIGEIPKMPEKWLLKEGWTRYGKDGAEAVDYPLEDGIIFDVEVCMREGPLPTIATAVTKDAWYGWVSKSVIDGFSRTFEDQLLSMDMLIPMESKSTDYGSKLNAFQKQPKIIVGHNVSYDRSRIKEQYWLNCTRLRFLDTMSLHICVSGINSYQRSVLNSKELSKEQEYMHKYASLNNLSDVHRLYCGHDISKEARSIFVEGTLADIKEDFNALMTYCASDVVATHNVLCQLFPLFQERFPHPVTLAGMLELGSAYLPINSNWQRYIEDAEATFEDLNYEAKVILARKADAACQLMHDDKYKEDPWMWDQDWSTQNIKLKSLSSAMKLKNKRAEEQKEEESGSEKYLTDDEREEDPLVKEFAYLEDTKYLLPARMPHMPGYPAWYRKLCPKMKDENWVPGPQNISTSMQVVPKLLNLTWENYPLHYIRGKGWGILVPHSENPNVETKVPIKQLLVQCPLPLPENIRHEDVDYSMLTLSKEVEDDLHKTEFWQFKKGHKFDASRFYKGTGVWCNEDIENCCYFFKLQHKDGENYNVGNPLAKDFLNKFSENVLSCADTNATQLLKIARMLSYWRNNRGRIMSQFAIWFDDHYLPPGIKKSKAHMHYGAILPVVIVSGTLTRRAVEPTWMTASNAHIERIGSELRGMVQAPSGYNIVGADVDSQELWIASLIGDSHYKKVHGATPFGWMTLIGTKSNGTDMHSITAKAVGISRSHAKVINYARIYGAGQKFAERLLRQFNPAMTEAEATSKSRKMFSLTKGKKVYRLRPECINDDLYDKQYTFYEAYKLAKMHSKTVSEMFAKSEWIGGSESAMFNRLEQIASSPHPATPFLNSRLTRALETETENSDKYLPTKVNWVVQSGAVDFLHLMLVSMRWLMKDNARFCLSFHDEVRYLVPSRYKYNAALAMHVTNLLTRSFCASRLGMKDLPMSVAFFTSVEVDTVLRKESHDDCKTPSNPHGLQNRYEIAPGESLNVSEAIEKSEGSLGSWHNMKKTKTQREE